MSGVVHLAKARCDVVVDMVGLVQAAEWGPRFGIVVALVQGVTTHLGYERAVDRDADLQVLREALHAVRGPVVAMGTMQEVGR